MENDLGSSSNGATAVPSRHSRFQFTRPREKDVAPKELRLIVPLADTTIYEMERRGEFPRRFNLTLRCVVWDLAEVEAWIEQRRKDSDARLVSVAPSPDVRLRRTRPVKLHPQT